MGRFKSRKGSDGRPSKGLRRTIRQDSWSDEDEDRPSSDEARPSEIHLRRMRANEATARLEMMIDQHRRQGESEVLIVHGRGLQSEGGQQVIAPLVLAWLKDNPDRIASWERAPRKWGGEGALLVRLRRMS